MCMVELIHIFLTTGFFFCADKSLLNHELGSRDFITWAWLLRETLFIVTEPKVSDTFASLFSGDQLVRN